MVSWNARSDIHACDIADPASIPGSLLKVLEEIKPGTKAITDPLSLHTSDVEKYTKRCCSC